jgi:hypothetical protein
VTTLSVAVAVPTYRRTDTLRSSLEELRLQLGHVPGAWLLVVDNDDVPGAEPIVRAMAEKDPRVHYVHEPVPGIAAARNRALVAAGDADLLVFIDDDELPGEQWLARLVATWLARHQPVAVVGPVVAVFEAEPDPWVTAGEFYRSIRHATGDEVDTAETKNLLLDMHEVRRWGLRFDPAGPAGDADEVFARQLCAHGGRIVWCEEAVVFDRVPADHATRGWARARAAQLADSALRAQVHLARPGLPRLCARLSGTAQGGARLAVGVARLGYGRLCGSMADEARGTRTLSCGAGMLRGSWRPVAYEPSR